MSTSSGRTDWRLSGWARLLLAGLLVIATSSIWIAYAYSSRAVDAEIADGIQQAVSRMPDLKPLYDEAMRDGTLTMSEADAILDAAEKRASHRAED